MNYERQNFINGQIVTADNLNYIEAGLEAISANARARNLLDNSDFRNPVNQRAVTSTKWGGYNIDRWSMFPSGTRGDEHCGVVKNSYINLTSTVDGYVDFYQKMERYDNIKGGTYTFTAKLLYNGNLVTSVCTFAMGGEGYGKNLTADGLVQFFSTSEGNVLIRVNNNAGAANTVSLVWAALYEGEYTADTLPEYIPKGYTAELLECQRYYLKLEGSANVSYPAYTVSTTQTDVTIPIAVPMRVTPTLTVGDVGGISVYAPSSANTATAVVVQNSRDHAIALRVTVDLSTAWRVACARFYTDVELSADL